MPREQGDIGERAADFDGQLLRVQVKTSACRYKQRWALTVCTRGGNQSWQGMVKRLDPSEFDYLFALVGDGRQWFIPAERIEGATAIHLGGPKYSEFEVERGDPIPAARAQCPPLQSASAPTRGDVRVAKGGGL